MRCYVTQWWPACVQPPSPPGKLAAQLNRLLAILVATAISNIRGLFFFISFGYILVSKKFNLLVCHCHWEKPFMDVILQFRFPTSETFSFFWTIAPNGH